MPTGHYATTRGALLARTTWASGLSNLTEKAGREGLVQPRYHKDVQVTVLPRNEQK